MRKRFPSFSTRGWRYIDFFFLQHRGIRVGYASPRLLRHLAHGKRARVRGRAILILTADARYSLRGVHPGSTLKAAARTRRLSPPYRVGGNSWYLAPNGFSREVLKVQRGPPGDRHRVREPDPNPARGPAVPDQLFQSRPGGARRDFARRRRT